MQTLFTRGSALWKNTCIQLKVNTGDNCTWRPRAMVHCDGDGLCEGVCRCRRLWNVQNGCWFYARCFQQAGTFHKSIHSATVDRTRPPSQGFPLSSGGLQLSEKECQRNSSPFGTEKRVLNWVVPPFATRGSLLVLTQSYLTLCNSLVATLPGFLVLYYLLELAHSCPLSR